ncbi:hypothetical protein MPH_13153 [Macrophomina phaseolina MS6]|uniref:Uncharacterized protein n=1 Tax=Macrophomina phaseolina (strain MS6) TaxID=1126212 RepID=K2R6G6_MACPH|nr:hypothetical protein MPH_13153 [Macrophomina phaseolina MS6]
MKVSVVPIPASSDQRPKGVQADHFETCLGVTLRRAESLVFFIRIPKIRSDGHRKFRSRRRGGLSVLVSSKHPHHVVRGVQDQGNGQDRDAPPSGDEGEDSAEAVDGATSTQWYCRMLFTAAKGLKLEVSVGAAWGVEVNWGARPRRRDWREERKVLRGGRHGCWEC